MRAHRLAGCFRLVALDRLEHRLVAGETLAVLDFGVGHVDALIDQPFDQRLMHGEEDRIAWDDGQDAVKRDIGDGESPRPGNGVLPGMKAAFRVIGVDCGPTRAPMAPAVKDAEDRMRAVLARPAIKEWLA